MWTVRSALEHAEKMQILRQRRQQRTGNRDKVEDKRRPFQFVSVVQTVHLLHLVATICVAVAARRHHVAAAVLCVVLQHQPLDVAQFLVQIMKPAFCLLMYRIPFRLVILV